MLSIAAAPPEARDLIRRHVRLIPHESLGELVLEMVEGALAAAPDAPTSHGPNPAAAARNGSKRPRVRPRSGRPPGRPRKAARPSAEANGAAAPAPAVAGEHASNGSGRKAAALAFWQAAEKLDPVTPWKPAADRLGINRALCQDAHKLHALPPLPPGLSPEEAVAAFLKRRLARLHPRRDLGAKALSDGRNGRAMPACASLR